MYRASDVRGLEGLADGIYAVEPELRWFAEFSWIRTYRVCRDRDLNFQ